VEKVSPSTCSPKSAFGLGRRARARATAVAVPRINICSISSLNGRFRMRPPTRYGDRAKEKRRLGCRRKKSSKNGRLGSHHGESAHSSHRIAHPVAARNICGKAGGEPICVIDMMVVRKDHGLPTVGAKRGDNLQILFIQVKGEARRCRPKLMGSVSGRWRGDTALVMSYQQIGGRAQLFASLNCVAGLNSGWK
jgi:hypothetical protein